MATPFIFLPILSQSNVDETHNSIDTAATNVSDVQRQRLSWLSRNTANADHRTTRCSDTAQAQDHLSARRRANSGSSRLRIFPFEFDSGVLKSCFVAITITPRVATKLLSSCQLLLETAIDEVGRL